jgi:hypothetical protein
MMHDGLLNFHSVFLDTLYKGNVDVSREGPCLSTNFPTKDFAPNVEVLLEFTGSCISHNPQLFSSPPTLAVWHRPFKCTLFYRVSPKKIEYPLKRDRNNSSMNSQVLKVKPVFIAEGFAVLYIY